VNATWTDVTGRVQERDKLREAGTYADPLITGRRPVLAGKERA